MAIQESDLMDFGNGIIGDDTFDVWRKKTNRIKKELDDVNNALTLKINTDFANLTTGYIPSSGAATSVSTALQFTSPITFTNSISLGSASLITQNNKLTTTNEFESSNQISGSNIKAENNLILGQKTYAVPGSPQINNAVLVSQTNGDLSWANIADIFSAAGGFVQNTNVFEEVMPVGSVVPLAGEIVEEDDNFILCDGRTLSKSGYGDLFDVIQYTYGGSGNNFKVPDYSGRVLVGTGTDTAGATSFSNSIGVFGGTNVREVGGTSLSIDQIPAHRHKFYDNNGNSYSAVSDGNQGEGGVNSDNPGRGTDASNLNEIGGLPGPTGDYVRSDAQVQQTSYTGGMADGGIHGGKTVEDDLANLISGGAAATHTHTISANSRIQPYVTVKWYIKAKKNSKVNFKIDLADSGLASTRANGDGQTVISPVDETISLKVNVDSANMRIANGELSIQHAPQIQGTIDSTGPDYKLDNATRRGGFTNINNANTRRALVHGAGASAGDPRLLGRSRSSVTTLRDQYGPGGTDELVSPGDNDTLIINYNSVSPNSYGDYTNGVIINGTRSIMFQDGSILNSAGGRKGPFKQEIESSSGKHSTVSPQQWYSVGLIDDEGDPNIGGRGNYRNRTGSFSPTAQFSTTHKAPLPDHAKASKLYSSYTSFLCIGDNGRAYARGYVPTSAPLDGGSTYNSSHRTWHRAFSESANTKFDKIITASDSREINVFALDEQGYLWGYGMNSNHVLNNKASASTVGYGTASIYETDAVAGSGTIVEKRELLVNSETQAAGVPYNLDAGNRVRLPHPTNPMLDANGDITTDVGDAVSLVKFTDAALQDSQIYSSSSTYRNTSYFNSGANTYNYTSLVALGTDGKVYSTGYGTTGSLGQGLSGGGSPPSSSTWGVVMVGTGSDGGYAGTTYVRDLGTGSGGPVTKIYSGGTNLHHFYHAILENGDVYAWGSSNNSNALGLSGSNVSRKYQVGATNVWNASEKGYKASYLLTSDCHDVTGSNSSDILHAHTFLISEEDAQGNTLSDKKVWIAGNANGSSDGSFQELTHGCFNTSSYSIKDIYLCDNDEGLFYYVIARKKENNKLELWAAGGNSFYVVQLSTGATSLKLPVLQRFNSDLLEKVVNIRGGGIRTNDSYGDVISYGAKNISAGTFAYMHLSDGRTFFRGKDAGLLSSNSAEQQSFQDWKLTEYQG